MDEQINHAFSLIKDHVYPHVNVSIFSNMIQIDRKTIELKIAFIFQYLDDVPNETREETIQHTAVFWNQVHIAKQIRRKYVKYREYTQMGHHHMHLANDDEAHILKQKAHMMMTSCNLLG